MPPPYAAAAFADAADFTPRAAASQRRLILRAHDAATHCRSRMRMRRVVSILRHVRQPPRKYLRDITPPQPARYASRHGSRCRFLMPSGRASAETITMRRDAAASAAERRSADASAAKITPPRDEMQPAASRRAVYAAMRGAAAARVADMRRCLRRRRRRRLPRRTITPMPSLRPITAAAAAADAPRRAIAPPAAMRHTFVADAAHFAPRTRGAMFSPQRALRALPPPMPQPMISHAMIFAAAAIRVFRATRCRHADAAAVRCRR